MKAIGRKQANIVDELVIHFLHTLGCLPNRVLAVVAVKTSMTYYFK